MADPPSLAEAGVEVVLSRLRAVGVDGHGPAGDAALDPARLHDLRQAAATFIVARTLWVADATPLTEGCLRGSLAYLTGSLSRVVADRAVRAS